VSTGNGKSSEVYKMTRKTPEACDILKGG